MLDEKTAVDRTTIDLTVDGRRSRISIEGVTDSHMTPLTNPVTGDENVVRIVKTSGFIWADGEIAESETFRVDLPEMSWDLFGPARGFLDLRLHERLADLFGHVQVPGTGTWRHGTRLLPTCPGPGPGRS